jgi:hypothetical protein
MVLFGISTTAFILQILLSKRYFGFSIMMISGGILEVLGYAGRLWARDYMWTEVCDASSGVE